MRSRQSFAVLGPRYGATQIRPELQKSAYEAREEATGNCVGTHTASSLLVVAAVAFFMALGAYLRGSNKPPSGSPNTASGPDGRSRRTRASGKYAR